MAKRRVALVGGTTAVAVTASVVGRVATLLGLGVFLRIAEGERPRRSAPTADGHRGSLTPRGRPG